MPVVKVEQGGAAIPLPPDVRLKTVSVQVPDSSATAQANFYYTSSLSLSRRAALVIFGNQPAITGSLQIEESARAKIEAVLSAHLADAGFGTYAYVLPDCSGKSAQTCSAPKRTDIDEQGPLALAADVDQLCEQARRQWLRSGSEALVLITFGQASAAVLGSACAEQAKAIFMISPVFVQQDKAWVDALEMAWRDKSSIATYDRSKVRNQAASVEATFSSMRNKLFSPDARVLGATVDYWMKWSDLGPNSAKEAAKLASPQIYVVPGKDYMMHKANLAAVRAVSASRKGGPKSVVDLQEVNGWLSNGSGPDIDAVMSLVELVKKYAE